MPIRELRYQICLLGALSCALLPGCGKKESQPSTYFDRKISPIVQQSCATSPTKSFCHKSQEHFIADPNDPMKQIVASNAQGVPALNALGNLDVTSYPALMQRRDLFLRYGPYGLPALLVKVVGQPFQISLTTWKSAPIIVTTNIAHQGGSLLDPTSPSLTLLDTWISNGYAANNAAAAPPPLPTTPCTDTLGSDPAFDPTVDPTTADFSEFTLTAGPILARRCANGNCHGSPVNTLYLTCGTTAEEARWNYFAASNYVATDPAASEILRRALEPHEGGVYHEGGTIFSSVKDQEYQTVLQWATDKGGPTSEPTDPAFLFFAERVQPVLAKRGCMMLNCHSTTMFHDYRLRGGSGGHFSLAATTKNYELTLDQLALESADPNASRLIRKNLAPDMTQGGMLHRGGALFAGHNSCTAAELTAAADPNTPVDTVPEYCVILQWFKMEQAARFPALQPLTGIAFVRRPASSTPDTPQDFASYTPGAQVIEIAASIDPTTLQVTPGAETNLTALCSGLGGANVDARRPAVSWDGKQIAFAARTSSSDPFHIYVVENGACSVQPEIDATPVTDSSAHPFNANGELIHNFDPTFAPDGSIVFASTRGNVTNVDSFGYFGPQRTPADPSRLNANLYVLDKASGAIRQLTFLLNQELSPGFMRDGRVIMVTEKRAPGFYQLAGRRQNLDGGDYHPLFGQRDSIGYDQLTDLVELTDKNFAFILSDHTATHSAGTLAILNRSVGVDQSMDPNAAANFAQDPSALNFPDIAFYQHSLRIVDSKATGKGATVGAYRSPARLPSKNLLVSYAANVTDLANFSGNFDIVEVDPSTGAQRAVVSGPDDELWPVAVGPRYNREIFRSRLDEANAATQVLTDPAHKDHAEVTYLDLPLLTSLLFQNTRTGRQFSPAPGVSFWQDLPPDPGIVSMPPPGQFVFADAYGSVFVKRVQLGAPPIYADGSSTVQLPGGAPILLQVSPVGLADAPGAQHFQREEMQFYPGEVSRQSFQRGFFNGMCAGCHGSLSGQEVQISPNPDILTQASAVIARGAPLSNLIPSPPPSPASATQGPVAP